MTHNCSIANCTAEATHDVMGHPDDGFTVVPVRVYPVYCEPHAHDVAAAFSAYRQADRDAAYYRIVVTPLGEAALVVAEADF